MMRMKGVHLETGEPREAAHSRPTERTLYEVEMDDDVVVMAKMRVKWMLVCEWDEDEGTTMESENGGKGKLLLLEKTMGGNWAGKNQQFQG